MSAVESTETAAVFEPHNTRVDTNIKAFRLCRVFLRRYQVWIGTASALTLALASWAACCGYASLLPLAVAILIPIIMKAREPAVYCVDHQEFFAPKSWEVSHEDVISIMSTHPNVTEESKDFARRVLTHSGIGSGSALPPNLIKSLRTGEPWSANMADAREEMEFILTDIIQGLLDKTGVKPQQIDFLVLNCSFFNPTPSLSAMVSHKFGFRSDCLSYNLSGMGCSANGISMDLGRRLLEHAPLGSLCVVVSAESYARQFYSGNERSRVMSNVLFRNGATAALLTNWNSGNCKYELLDTVRAQVVKDEAIEAAWQGSDKEGLLSLCLNKSIVPVAGEALMLNLEQLLPRMSRLPKFLRYFSRSARLAPSDLPNVVDFFCIHAGGRAVIDNIMEVLNLTEKDVNPSRESLSRHGNTMSTSVWYEMGILEKTGKLRPGDSVLQIALGSGFKCNTALWLCL
ncbi:inositol polyphosphate kinase kcs1 [Perkinsus chesapeaki]|uniref:3-ketoacyl-CoA synthase n=1 Tax=Perkinsus chesapeaki TaxID=330153 RepID=A0A7J6LZW3_PERCH|nr:inositol polyphosphate kinase kcs1 [Perkinsus chesapeaki]